MILPTKGVPPSKALITVGGEILNALGSASRSVSSLWSEVGAARTGSPATRISYDWFVLALDVLFAIGAVELTDFELVRRAKL